MALRDNRKFDGWNGPVAAARPLERVISVGDSELTDERFIRAVALALRAQWEGDGSAWSDPGHQALAAIDPDPGVDWSEYRGESVAAILAFLDELGHRGLRIVRQDN